MLILKSGYWKIPVEAASKHYTAFSTTDGNSYEFTVMRLELKNAPTTFQRMMNDTLSGIP